MRVSWFLPALMVATYACTGDVKIGPSESELGGKGGGGGAFDAGAGGLGAGGCVETQCDNSYGCYNGTSCCPQGRIASDCYCGPDNLWYCPYVRTQACWNCVQKVWSLTGACAAQADACRYFADCFAIHTCFYFCSENCGDKCEKWHPDGLPYWQAYTDCICQTGCPSECAVDCTGDRFFPLAH